MNEGEGYSFRDASGNGNNAETNGQAVPEWIQDVRIDGK